MESKFRLTPLDPGDPARADWGDGWRLLPLSEGRLTVFPPLGVDDWQECQLTRRDLVESGSSTPLVVFGEEGGGFSSLRRWMEHVVGQGETATLASETPAYLPQDEPAATALARRLAAQIPDLPTEEPGKALHVADQLAAYDGKQPLVVLLRGLPGKAQTEDFRDLFARLRGHVEHGRYARVKTVFFAREPEILATDPDFSAFLTVCNVFRMASLTEDDISGIWRKNAQRYKKDVGRVARECLKATGGQPLLAQLFLLQVDTGRCKPEDAGDWLNAHPPGTVLQWQRRLARLVRDDAYVGAQMRDYLADASDPAPTRESLPLFVAGWVGLRPDGRWGIRSEAHRQWAGGPVRSPAGFLR